VVRRLRARALPTRLFGESDKDALRRLRKHEMDQPDVNKGWQNEFQSALKKVEDEEMEVFICFDLFEVLIT
jgi:pre-mRNA-splicing factor 18